MQSRSSYFFPGLLAVGLHVLIILFIASGFKFEKTIKMSAISEPVVKETIDAMVVNQHALEQEVRRLETVERNKLEKEQSRIARLKKEEAKLKKQVERKKQLAQRQEQERLAKMKKEQAELAQLKKEKKQRIAEEKKAKEARIAAEKQREAARVAAEKKREAARIAAEKKRQEAEKQAKIAAEKKRQEEARLAKIEAEKKRKIAEKKRLAAEKARLAAEEKAKRAKHKALIKRQVNLYAGLIQAKIHQNWRQPVGLELLGKTCKVAVKLESSGEIISVRVIESSGNLEFDRSTELAVLKSSPLPLPADDTAKAQFKDFTFTFNPEAV